MRELEDLSKKRYVSPSSLATVDLGLSKPEKAIDWLEKAFDDRDPVLWWIGSDQLYDSVREGPRFQVLTKKIANLQDATEE